MSILVLGIGNAVMSDDAFGCRAIEALAARFRFPEGVTLLDGGTLGLDLLPRFEGVERLVVLDAIDMGEPAGTPFRLEAQEVPRAFAGKLSVHQMGVQDLLALAELQGHLPNELVAWGVQPSSIEMGLELSPEVEGALPEVIEGVRDELRRWGVELQPHQTI